MRLEVSMRGGGGIKIKINVRLEVSMRGGGQAAGCIMAPIQLRSLRIATAAASSSVVLESMRNPEPGYRPGVA